MKNKIPITFAFLTLCSDEGDDMLSPNIPAIRGNVYKAFCLPIKTKFHHVRYANKGRAINISSIIKLMVPTLLIFQSYK